MKDNGTHGTMAEFVDAFVEHHSMYAHMDMHSRGYPRATAEDRAHFARALGPGGIIMEL